MKIGKDILGSKCSVYLQERRQGGKVGDTTYFIRLVRYPGGVTEVWKSHGEKYNFYSNLKNDDNIIWLKKFLNANASKIEGEYFIEYVTRDSGINETFKQLVKLGDDGLRTIAQTMDPKDLKGIRKVLSAMKKIL
jgi:hypothetical protein